jgi:hypothetical protein
MNRQVAKDAKKNQRCRKGETGKQNSGETSPMCEKSTVVFS